MFPSEAKPGMRVRLTAEVRAKGIMPHPWRGERNPDWTGGVERLEVRTVNGEAKTWALCSHAEEICGCHLKSRSNDCYRCAGTGAAVRRWVLLDEIEPETRTMIVALVLRRYCPPGRATTGACRRAYQRLRRELLDNPYILRYVPLRRAIRLKWREAAGTEIGAVDQILGEVGEARHLVLYSMPPSCGGQRMFDASDLARAAYDLLEQAADLGYWEDPRPLRYQLKHPIALPASYGGSL